MLLICALSSIAVWIGGKKKVDAGIPDEVPARSRESSVHPSWTAECNRLLQVMLCWETERTFVSGNFGVLSFT